MRPYPGALVVISIALPLSTLSAQARTSAFEGTWRHVGTEIMSPEGASKGPHFDGQVVISGRYYSQTWIARDTPGGKATGELTAAKKADRYDALTANAGTIEVGDTLVTFKLGVAKDPRVENTPLRGGYRIRGDTLWLRFSEPWEKDATKTVRATWVFARMR